MKRRDFLKRTVAAAAVAELLPSCATRRSAAVTAEENIETPPGLGAAESRFVVTERTENPPASRKLLTFANDSSIAWSPAQPVLGETRGSKVSDAPKTQYVLVQITLDKDGRGVVTDPYSNQPELTGKTMPDVGISLQLAGFHLGRQVEIRHDSRAIMRITTTNRTDVGGTGSVLFWTFATGLDLYRQSRRPEATKANVASQGANLSDATSNRPIQMPGGVGSLQVELVKQREPSWWRKVFSFLASGEADIISESVGFPAITGAALKFVDNFFTKLEDANAEVLMSSDFFPYAFSEAGRAQYEKGARKIGKLNSGTWALVAVRHYEVLKTAQPYFYGSAGRLIPSGREPIPFLQEVEQRPDKDPFADVTYAVFDVTLSEAKYS